ncbi:MAG: hypothetical protein IKX60_02665 [Bacteroidales bacterium]|nr:hypothetical protein [Bacteroidales bacterium]
MSARLFTLTSDLHSETYEDVRREPFIQDVEAALGYSFDIAGNDFSSYGTHPCELIYVRTGGTEGLFKEIFCKDGGKPDIPEPVRLLTSGKSNSLAASMEILSYLNNYGIKGEILHGSPGFIADRIATFNQCHPERSEGSDLTISVSPGRILEGCRLGVVGHPSDWLISSDVDYRLARSVLGVELIDISMQELLMEISGHSHPAVDIPALNTPKFGNPIPEQDLSIALDIYGALLHIIARHRLSGLTIRCFDLLGTVRNTGCMALALLNSQGYTATCEGDIPAMISMAVARKVCGQSGFQANLSSIHDDKFLFAHCTVPLSMTRSWVYDTHFESGIGVAVHGELPPGPATIFKLAPDFKTAFIAKAKLECNCYEGKLCRTQVILTAKGIAPYFLHNPIGNHHVILTGDYTKALKKVLVS